MLANPRVPCLILDLDDPEDIAFIWRLLNEFKPKRVRGGLRCTCLGRLGRLTGVRSVGEWQRLRQRALGSLMLAVRIVRWLHNHA
eukprot:5660390-Lingulodinium_polyedra.AAC.1